MTFPSLQHSTEKTHGALNILNALKWSNDLEHLVLPPRLRKHPYDICLNGIEWYLLKGTCIMKPLAQNNQMAFSKFMCLFAAEIANSPSNSPRTPDFWPVHPPHVPFMILPICGLWHVELKAPKSTWFGGPGPHCGWNAESTREFSLKKWRFGKKNRKAIGKQRVIQPTIWWGVFHGKNLVHVCICLYR